MARLGFIIDLEKCYGCDACALACRDVHLLPPGVSFLKVARGDGDARETAPVLCMHCDDPACRGACAFDAMRMDDDGVVIVDDDACTGCGACVEACPIDALRVPSADFTGLPTGFMSDEQRRVVEKWAAQRERGVPSKCALCPEHRRKGRPPACVSVCPVRAIEIGDLDDPDSGIRRRLREAGERAVAHDTVAGRVFYLLPEDSDPAAVRRLIASIG